MVYTTEPMNTLENFGQRELATLNELLHAYSHAGQFYVNPVTKEGKQYAQLPATWYNERVYPDFNSHSGNVFLSNNEQSLVLTEYGVAEFYYTSYNGYEGTLFDLAEKVLSDLTDRDNNPISADETVWHDEDLNQVYEWLNLCISDFFDTGADVFKLCRAKELIAKSFILEQIPSVAIKFNNSDAYRADELEPVDNWHETLLAQELLHDCLIKLEHETDDDEDKLYVEFIREQILKHLERGV